MGATFLMCDLYRASVKGPSTEDGTVGVTEPDLMSPPRPTPTTPGHVCLAVCGVTADSTDHQNVSE